MAATAQNSKQKLQQAGFYDELPEGFVYTGIGTLPYQIYKSDAYQKRKQKPLIIGGINRIVYSGFEQDPTPIILTMVHEPQYNTVLSINLRYLKPQQKKMLLEYILNKNKLRIKQKKPLLIPEWKLLKRRFPWLVNVIRRYKLTLIGVVETVPLIGWPSVMKESSPYSWVGSQRKKQ